MIRSVKEIIEKDLYRLKEWDGLAKSQVVVEATREVIGRELSSQVKVLGFKNGVVLIGTPNSTFNQELSFFEKEIIDRVNELLGDSGVKRIKFVELW